MSKFSVGMKVARKSDYWPLEHGVILLPYSFKDEDEQDDVSGWVVDWGYPSIYFCNEDEILTEEEYLALEQKHAEEKARMDAEFGEARALITDQLNQAADLITSATALARQSKHHLADLYDETYKLIGAIKNVGWRSSSLSC